MATRIRLRRVGRKKLPLYRIVVADEDVAAGRPVHRRDRHLLAEGQGGGGPDHGRRREGARLARQGRDGLGDGQVAAPEGRASSSSRGLMTDGARHIVVGRFRRPHGLKGECTDLPADRRPGTGLRGGTGARGGGSRGGGGRPAAHGRAEPVVPPRVAAEVRRDRAPGWARALPERVPGGAGVRRDAAGRGRGLPPRARRVRGAARGRHAARAGERRTTRCRTAWSSRCRGRSGNSCCRTGRNSWSQVDRAARRLVIAPPDGLLDE